MDCHRFVDQNFDGEYFYRLGKPPFSFLEAAAIKWTRFSEFLVALRVRQLFGRIRLLLAIEQDLAASPVLLLQGIPYLF